MDNEKKISHTERLVNASKFKVKDLMQKSWSQFDKPPKERKDFEPEIQAARNELANHRQNLAILIIEHYNLFQ